MHFVTLALNDIEHRGTETITAAAAAGGVILRIEHVSWPPYGDPHHPMYCRTESMVFIPNAALRRDGGKYTLARNGRADKLWEMVDDATAASQPVNTHLETFDDTDHFC